MMNCLVVDDEEFSRNVVKLFIDKTEGLNLLGECENAVDAFGVLKNEKVDLLFLDVEMPDMSGIDLVKTLEDLPEVILITARPDYAVEAFEYSITDYLVKPINYPRFLKAVEKSRSNKSERQVITETNADDIYVKSDSKIVKIRLDSILFIEALSDYVKIFTETGFFVVHSTMKGLEKRLPSDFCRVHRSYIVNLERIDTIEDMNIIMPKKTIPIGASYKAKFIERLNFL